MMDDWQLLKRYSCEDSQEAFAEVVNRHLALVYSAALRQAHDAELAWDVTQMVFANLARRAKSLKPTGTLAGWLHRDTRFTALAVLRRDRRRVAREQEVAAMQNGISEPPPDWSRIRPALDAALDQLGQIERDALLLRFFEQRSLKEIGAALGLEEDAARKRISRAMEKLRLLLSREGVTTSTAALSVALTTQALQAAPAGLAATVLASSLAAGTSIAGGVTTFKLIETIAMTKLKSTVAAVLVAAGVGTPLVLQYQASKTLRDENRQLRAQAGELAELRAENGRLSNQATQFQTSTLTGEQLSELLRLRNEMGWLRQQTNELAALRRERAQLLAKAQAGRTGSTSLVPGSNDIASAKAVIFDPAEAVHAKLAALEVLRSANARSDDVVKQMVEVYYATTDMTAREEIFRQMNGVTTPDLKRPLLEAVSDPANPRKMREEATETLAGYLPDPDAKAWLDYLAANDPEPKVREQAGRSLRNSERQPPR